MSEGRTFKEIPRDLYRQVEPEAGNVLPALKGRYRSYRPHDEFEPNWTYLLSGHASKAAVVAGLYNGLLDVPSHVWPKVVELYCPRAWRLLVEAGVTYEQWNTGRCPAELGSSAAAVANAELDGYEVFAVMDVPAMVAEIIGTLGTVPRFE